MTEHEIPDEGEASLRRRRFLQQAAVAGGLAWTAPMLISSPAAAQGTGPCAQVDWGTVTLPSFVLNGSTVTVTQAHAGPGSSGILVQVGGFPLGSDTNYLRLNYTNIDAMGGSTITINYTFAPAITNLVIPWLDIDGLVTRPEQVTSVTVPTSQVLGSNVLNPAPGVYRSAGATVSNFSTAGNAILTYAGPVAALTFLVTVPGSIATASGVMGNGDLRDCPP